MGAPGYTMFCENGHIVDVVGHHEISQYDYPEDGSKRPPCLCGSENFKRVTEWGDPDYHNDNGDGPVSSNPTGEDEFVSDKKATVVTHGYMSLSGNEEKRVTGKLVVKIDKYDVSKLFNEEEN